MGKMGNECLKRKEMYICDHCREVRPWPPHIIATVRTQRTWFFCCFECWRAWVAGH